MLTVGLYAMPDPQADVPGGVHDHAIAMMSSARVIHHIELERVTRKKHDNSLPLHLERWVREAVIDLPSAFQLVSVDNCEGAAFSTPGKGIAIQPSPSHGLSGSLEQTEGRFLDHKVEYWSCSHELAHVGSHLPFVGRFAENSLMVHVDGGASLSNASVWRFRDGQIVPLYDSWELQPAVGHFFLDSLSYAILGLPREAELELAGKLMGYAAFGTASPELLAWLKEHDWFRSCGPNWAPFFRAARDLGVQIEGFDTHDRFLMDIAACMQLDFEDEIVEFIERFRRATGARQLYFSGGAALNIQLNARLEREGGFDRIFIPPCCNDSGLALGAAALLEFQAHGELEPCSPFLNDVGITCHKPTCPSAAVQNELVDRLAIGQVVALFHGAAEIGPRALGHRSLLAHPGSVALRDRISRKMKQREWYRPVAPVILRRDADALFPGSVSSTLSPLMLRSSKVAPQSASRISGVVHTDGSARVQTVDEYDTHLAPLANLLRAVRDIHGIPCLINTSFNLRGEPLVHTPLEAMHTARALGVDAMLLEDELISFSPPTSTYGSAWTHSKDGTSS